MSRFHLSSAHALADQQQPARPELSRRKSLPSHSSTFSLLLSHLPPSPSKPTMSTRTSSRNSMPVSRRIISSVRISRKRSSPVPSTTLPARPYSTRMTLRMRTWKITRTRMRIPRMTTRYVLALFQHVWHLVDMLVKGAEAPAAGQDCKQQ